MSFSAPQEVVEVVNREAAEAKLAGVAERMADPTIAFGAVMRELEEEEKSIFESYGGKYVNSGELEASLTDASAAGAVRVLTPRGVEFGSSVWYARYQGTHGLGEHELPSAILKVTEKEKASAQVTLMEYIMHGGRV